jgi:general secretion pathway protein E
MAPTEAEKPQRLVRLLCVHCRQAYTPDASECALLGIAAEATHGLQLFAAAGCAACKHTGFQHRKGIFELVQVDADMRRLIHDGAGEAALLAQARRQGASLQSDGLRCVLNGETTLAEVLRVSAA